MARMPDFETEIKRDLGQLARVLTRHHHGVHPFGAPVTRDDIPAAASRAPAPQPVNLRTTAPKENTMSVATDVETWYADVKAKLGEAEQKLPVLIASARKLEGNPLAQVAVQAAEHLAAGILPPEALGVLASNAGKLLNDLIGLYNPQPGQAAPSAPDPAQPAPAPQQVPA